MTITKSNVDFFSAPSSNEKSPFNCIRDATDEKRKSTEDETETNLFFLTVEEEAAS